MGSTNIKRRKAPRSPQADPNHPHSVPILSVEDDEDQTPDQPFAEGATDTVDADLRHRMISEAAFQRATERGNKDGYDLDDWLQAEAEVDHVLLNRGTRD
ncbi:MAG: DUF2934 domain-containing protein [Casimicrobiaceae bacterium]